MAHGNVGSLTRGVYCGGSAPGLVNVIHYLTLESAGSSADFGDLTEARSQSACLSNGHGGIEAFYPRP